METYLKKSLKIIIYSAVIVTGAVLALLPFMKKGEDFSKNYSPDTQKAIADIVTSGGGGGGGGDDDGGGI